MSIRKADTPARERKEWILVMKKHGIVISEILSAVLVSGMAVMPAFADVPETAAPASSIQVYTGHTYEMEWSRDAGRYLAESICPQAGLDERTEERYPELGRAFRELNEKKRKEFGEKYQEILEDAKERYQENPEYTGTFSDAESWYVQRADGHIVSLLGVHSGYIGGVHGYEGFSGMNYDPVSGSEWKLSDFVTDGERFKELVKEKVYSDYPEVEEDLTEETDRDGDEDEADQPEDADEAEQTENTDEEDKPETEKSEDSEQDADTVDQKKENAERSEKAADDKKAASGTQKTEGPDLPSLRKSWLNSFTVRTGLRALSLSRSLMTSTTQIRMT